MDYLRIYSDQGGAEDRVFKFFAFWSPPLTDEHFADVKQCGYTHLYLDRKFDAEPGTKKRLLGVQLCEKYQIHCILQNAQLYDSNDYSGFEYFDGVNTDEPLTVGELEALGREADAFFKRYPGRNFYVNAVDQSGDGFTIYMDQYRQMLTEKMPRRHVSGDDYPLLKEGKNTLHKHYQALEDFGNYASQTNSEFYYYLQTQSISGNNMSVRRPSKEDMMFLHHGLLVFGAKGFQHFCYTNVGQPPFDGEFREEDWALLDRYYEKTPTYFMTQEVIAYFKAMAPYILDFNWKGYLRVQNREGHPFGVALSGLRKFLNGFPGVKSIIAEDDLLVGCYANDHAPLSALYVTRAYDPCKTQPCEVSIKVDGTKVLVIRGKDKTLVECPDGVYSDTLGVADGFFLVFVKDNNTWQPEKDMLPAPQLLTVDQHGILSFRLQDELSAELFINEQSVGTVVNGQSVASYLQTGKNILKIRSIKGENVGPFGFERIVWKPAETLLREDFSDGLGNISTYNVYGCGKTHLELMSNGYPDGVDGKVLRMYTTTEDGHDWCCYQILKEPIAYVAGMKLLANIYIPPCGFSIGICDDPMTDCPSIREYTIDRIGFWQQWVVNLEQLGYKPGDTIEHLYITTGSGRPYGTVMYMSDYEFFI